MSTSDTPFNLAVPQAGLLTADGAALGFQGRGWTRLLEYVSHVQALPTIAEGATDAVDDASRALAHSVEAFGSAQELRDLLQRDPDGLTTPTPPEPLFAAMAWLSQRLSSQAQETSSALATLAEALAGGAAVGERVRALLWDITHVAARAMEAPATISASASRLRASVSTTDERLASAAMVQGAELQKLQVELGRNRQRVESLRHELEGLSVLARRRRRAVGEDLERAESDLAATRVSADLLRSAHARVEAVVQLRNWVGPGFDDVEAFLEAYRSTWKSLNRGLNALATRASDAELESPEQMNLALGLPDALAKWAHIHAAAQRFATQALRDR